MASESVPKRDAVPGLPARLVAVRESAGLSQAAAASLAGIDRPNLSHYETGFRTPGLAVTIRLARAYGVTLNDLVPTDELAALPLDEPEVEPTPRVISKRK